MIDNVDDALEQARQQAEFEAELAIGRELTAAIDFGLSVQQFLDGPIGRKLLADATRERLTLTEKYILLNPELPEDAKQMRDMRHRVMVLNCWQEFFERYISEGNEAEARLRAMEQPD